MKIDLNNLHVTYNIFINLQKELTMCHVQIGQDHLISDHVIIPPLLTPVIN